jgi:hypothetical protein
MSILKQSTATTRMLFMVDSSDHVSGKPGLTLTLTASKGGGAFASITPTVTERGSGWYAVAYTTAHTDTSGDFAVHSTAAGADPTDKLYNIVACDLYDAVRLGLSALPNAAAEAAGGLVTRGTGSGQVNVTTGVVDANVVKTNGSAAFAYDGLLQASASSGATSIRLASTESGSSPVGSVLMLIEGNSRQVVNVTAYNAGTQAATITPALGFNVTTATQYDYIGSVATVSGIVTVGGYATGQDPATLLLASPANKLATDGTGRVTAGSVGSGAIVAASFATDAIAAAAVSAGAVTKVQAGLSTLAAAGVWDLATTGHATTGTFGAAMVAAGSAGDPWSTALPGSYGSGTAGNIVGNRVDAAITSRATAAGVWDLATSGHTTSGTFGSAMTAAGAAGDPWSTAIPGSYGSGTAGNLVGNKLGLTIAGGKAAATVATGDGADSATLLGAWTRSQATGTVTAATSTTITLDAIGIATADLAGLQCEVLASGTGLLKGRATIASASAGSGTVRVLTFAAAPSASAGDTVSVL